MELPLVTVTEQFSYIELRLRLNPQKHLTFNDPNYRKDSLKNL